MLDFNRILVLAPHRDDAEFGCGGSIAKFVNEGKEVYCAAFSACMKDAFESEIYEATKRLGVPKKNLLTYAYETRKLNYFRQEILEELVRIQNELKPDLVFLPSQNDIHQDHQVIANEGIRAFKLTSVLGYEAPCNNMTFNTQVFICLLKQYIDVKMSALSAYVSQKWRRLYDLQFIEGLARVRGMQAGSEYAEAFEIIRWII